MELEAVTEPEWYRVRVPKGELDLDITLSSGQVFSWSSCDGPEWSDGREWNGIIGERLASSSSDCHIKLSCDQFIVLDFTVFVDVILMKLLIKFTCQSARTIPASIIGIISPPISVYMMYVN